VAISAAKNMSEEMMYMHFSPDATEGGGGDAADGTNPDPNQVQPQQTNQNVEVPDGFKETKEFGRQHGQKVYQKGSTYISRDVDGHNGGVWKVFEKKGGRLIRVGTANANLEVFKR
jgi:hypothetical protein